MQALYDDDKGIGLNIYRYNLGAGSKNDSHILTKNRQTECFLNAVRLLYYPGHDL